MEDGYQFKRIYKKSGITDLTPGSAMRAGQSHMAVKPKGWTLRQAAKPLIDYGRRKKLDLNKWIKGVR